MTKTDHYNLCLWEATDPIRREDFNADNAAIDAALGEIGYVKLLDVTAAESAQQIDLDVSGIDFTQYWEIELFLDCDVINSYVFLRANNATQGYRSMSVNSSSSAEYDYMLSFYAPGKRNTTFKLSRPKAGTCVAIGAEQTYFDVDYGRNQTTWGISTVTWDALTSLNFYRTSGTIPAGTRFVLRGLKK